MFSMEGQELEKLAVSYWMLRESSEKAMEVMTGSFQLFGEDFTKTNGKPCDMNYYSSDVIA